MGIYEASHPINHSNILQCKYSLHTPPETNRPALSGQLCLHGKTHGKKKKEPSLKGSNLDQSYWWDKKAVNFQISQFHPIKTAVVLAFQILIKDVLVI